MTDKEIAAKAAAYVDVIEEAFAFFVEHREKIPDSVRTRLVQMCARQTAEVERLLDAEDRPKH
jgi:hypothetical protein